MPPESDPEPNKATQRTIRLLRPSIVVFCGPAACGKSTFAEGRFRSTQVISSDWARARVCDDERDQRYQAQAFALVHFLIEQRLNLNRLCVVDSTALTVAARKELLDLARRHQVPCVLFLFDIPLEKCLERDAKRERTVGKPVIERQYQAFEQAKAAVRQEGFDQIVELHDEDLEKAQIEVVFRPVARPPAPNARPTQGPPRRSPATAPAPPVRPAGARDLRPVAQGRPYVSAPRPEPSTVRPGAADATPAPAPSVSLPAPPSPPAPASPSPESAANPAPSAPAGPAPDSSASQEPGKS
jgi:predicted kinase